MGKLADDIRSVKLDDPCKSCHYSTQACAYFLGDFNIEDACVGKLIWLRYEKRRRMDKILGV